MRKIITHVISGLKVGGAEMMLLRLILNSCPNKYEHIVISLSPDGEMQNRFVVAGIQLIVLDFKRSPLINFYRLFSLIKLYKPAIVQTWLYHADFLGGLAAYLAGSYLVVWNIRSTSIPQGPLSTSYWLVRICAVCSYVIPSRIICCANSAREEHIRLKYSKYKLTTIPNGFDFSTFDYLREFRGNTRVDLGIKDQEIVIGVVGRFDLLKDFHNFVSAAYLIVQKCANVRFLMVGRRNDWNNHELVGWINALGLIQHFNLVGETTDVYRFLSSMDIFCLSSVSEAFPNVVVEAMATGLPCVVTDAGDAAEILDDNNFVVPIKNTILLANALLKICILSESERKILGEKNRKRVMQQYAIENIKTKYEALYDLLAEK